MKRSIETWGKCDPRYMVDGQSKIACRYALALETALRIAKLSGRTQSQYVAKIEVALIEAMKWAQGQPTIDAAKIKALLDDNEAGKLRPEGVTQGVRTLYELALLDNPKA